MAIKPHSPAWYDRLAENQAGYFYPWKAQLPPLHGEDIFLQMVKEHTSEVSDVIEVACGHGELSLTLAPLCRSIVGYDRVTSWIERAQSESEQRSYENVTFVCYDSSSDSNDGQARLPADADSFDLMICSKGPFHWISDARRVARPGAVLLMLVPDWYPQTEWHSLLPTSPPGNEFASRIETANPNWAREAIEERLALAGLELDSWWSFDVPQLFPDPEELYIWWSWGKALSDIPSFSELRPVLEKIYRLYGGDEGVTLRYRRYIWKATVQT